MTAHIFKVRGQSMSPGYLPNDYVVTLRWPYMRYKRGDVIVIKHHFYQVIIKRIAKIKASDEFWLVGDNPQSTSSYALGWQPRSEIIGKVVWHCTVGNRLLS